MKKYAELIISRTTKELDKKFTYGIPDEIREKIQIGMRVWVSFGSGKKSQAFVVGFVDEIDFDESKLKYIDFIIDEKPIFSKTMIELAKWMRDKYYTTYADCLKCIMPSGIDMKSEYFYSVTDDSIIDKKTKAFLILEYIKNNHNLVSFTDLEQEFGNITSSMNSLEKKSAVTKTEISKKSDYIINIKYAYLNHEMSDEIEECINKGGIQAKILLLLRENRNISISDVKSCFNTSLSPINTLIKKNLIYIESLEVRRNIHQIYDADYEKPAILTVEQVDCINYINSVKSKKPILLHGVTGSGKTEIYLRIIENVLNDNKKAIVLVPEISLTPQTVSRFVSRFREKVSVTHSRLSFGERYDQWKKARDGEISIMIGARSAIFTPFDNIGVIIIDEEHENTYYSETNPKYNVHDIALKISELTGCMVILGTATPSINSYYNYEIGKYDLFRLKERVNKSLPEVSLVDLRKELENGNRSMFSHELREALIENTNNGKQSILFINRRGHSTFVSCRKCGHVLKCDNCNVNYTYHINSRKLICHYCSKQIDNPKKCPSCGSEYIKYFGIGTQKVEEEVKRLFPNEKILRMDMDTVSKKHSHESILNSFKNQEAKILIGTQMIAKGLDFPNVALVGIMAADTSLNTGDYRCAENTFQLLVQVSGRAGRAETKGKVIIQTYTPEHYSIAYAKTNDFNSFYKEEISLRRLMLYPPFTNIFTIVFISVNEKDIIDKLIKLVQIMNYYDKKGQFEIIGPSPTTVSKIKNRFRWRLIVKAIDEEKLKAFVFYTLNKLEKYENLKNIGMNLTLNPIMIQ